MAKKAKAVEPAVIDEGEVSPHEMAPAEEEGLSNGLGLEKFITAVKQKDSPAAAPKEKVVKPKPALIEKKAESAAPPTQDVKADDPSEDEVDTVETLSKRLKETRDWATNVNKQNKDLSRMLNDLTEKQKVLESRLDGTYVEPAGPTPEFQEQVAKFQERMKIDRAVAESQFGAALVEETIFADSSPYRELEQMDPLVKARVFDSATPVQEAIKAVKKWKFEKEYGDDYDVIVAKLKATVAEEVATKVKEQRQGRKTVEDVRGLGDVSSVSRGETPSGKPESVDLGKVFQNFPTGSF